MDTKLPPGLGELLRHVTEQIDQGAEAAYRAMGMSYRPRFTPVMRALAAGAETVTDITALSHLTQGAISQSLKLMLADGLVGNHRLADGRKSGVHLTPTGQALLRRLEPHWDVTFRAIAQLENEIGHPLLQVLTESSRALERQGFAERLKAIELERP